MNAVICIATAVGRGGGTGSIDVVHLYGNKLRHRKTLHGVAIHRCVKDSRQGMAVQLVAGGRAAVLLLAVAGHEGGERLGVVFQAEDAHRPEKVVGGHRLALLLPGMLVGLGGDEPDELRHAFLDRLFGLVGDPGVPRQNAAHDFEDVRQRDVVLWRAPPLISQRRRAVVRVGTTFTCIHYYVEYCYLKIKSTYKELINYVEC